MARRIGIEYAGATYQGEANRAHGQAEAERLLEAVLAVLGLQASQLAETAKGTVARKALAGGLRQVTAAVGVRTVVHGGSLSGDPSDADV